MADEPLYEAGYNNTMLQLVRGLMSHAERQVRMHRSWRCNSSRRLHSASWASTHQRTAQRVFRPINLLQHSLLHVHMTMATSTLINTTVCKPHKHMGTVSLGEQTGFICPFCLIWYFCSCFARISQKFGRTVVFWPPTYTLIHSRQGCFLASVYESKHESSCHGLQVKWITKFGWVTPVTCQKLWSTDPRSVQAHRYYVVALTFVTSLIRSSVIVV